MFKYIYELVNSTLRRLQLFKLQYYVLVRITLILQSTFDTQSAALYQRTV